MISLLKKLVYLSLGECGDWLIAARGATDGHQLHAQGSENLNDAAGDCAVAKDEY